MLKNPDLAALEHEFNYGGIMHLETYLKRREEIIERMEGTRAQGGIEVAAAATGRAPVASPPPHEPAAARHKPLMDATEKAEFKALCDRFSEARGRANAAAMADIISNHRFTELNIKNAVDKARDFVDQNGARTTTVLGLVFAARDMELKLFEMTSARTRELEARIRGLEARPAALSYGGTWASGQESRKGVFYTDRGAMWYCKESTRDRPGESDCFQLAVKAGRDGKDAR